MNLLEIFLLAGFVICCVCFFLKQHLRYIAYIVLPHSVTMKQDKKKQIYFSHFSIKNKVYKNHKKHEN